MLIKPLRPHNKDIELYQVIEWVGKRKHSTIFEMFDVFSVAFSNLISKDNVLKRITSNKT